MLLVNLNSHPHNQNSDAETGHASAELCERRKEGFERLPQTLKKRSSQPTRPVFHRRSQTTALFLHPSPWEVPRGGRRTAPPPRHLASSLEFVPPRGRAITVTVTFLFFLIQGGKWKVPPPHPQDSPRAPSIPPLLPRPPASPPRTA